MIRLASLSVGLLALTGSTAIADIHWNWEWAPAAGEITPTVAVCHLKYGKTWAYSLEIDDGPSSTNGAAALLSAYHYSDAPPGVPGGNRRPFTGSAAAFLRRVGGNAAYLTYADCRSLLAGGWDVANHSYAHNGSGTTPISAAEIREDHFWSQTLYAAEIGTGRAAAQFVYANGWLGYAGPVTGDFTYFAEAGFRSGTRASGSSPRNLFAPGCDVRDFKRTLLDNLNTSAPLRDFVAPTADDFIIELTHKMDPVEGSENRNAWATRLSYLESTYGEAGDDSVWSAPAAEVFDHVAAVKAATVSIARGRVHLSFPDGTPGAALTLKLSNIPADSIIATPPGGLVHRFGTTVWLTTPFLGQRGTAAPFPRVKRIYQGTVQNLTFGSPVRVAGVQLHQQGTAPEPLSIHLSTAAGPLNFATATGLGYNWGDRKLFSQIPTLEPDALPAALGLQVTTSTAWKELSVWVVDEAVRRWSEWQADSFKADDIVAGSADETADPDGDGLPNLLEYALSSDPRVPSASAAPSVSLEDGYLVLAYTRTAAHPDVTISVEASTDLADPTRWTLIAQSASGAPTINNGASEVVETVAGEITHVKVRDVLPAYNAQRRFLRVRVTH